jgi:cytochrome c peroxidase
MFIFITARGLEGQTGTDASASVSTPSHYRVPAAERPCLLPGNRADLGCVLVNDPDAKRIRREEAGVEAQSLSAAMSMKLDPSHEIVMLGALEIYDPSLSVNNNTSCGFCHDPASGFKSGISFLNEYTGGSTPGSVPIHAAGAYPNYRIAKRNPQSYVYATFSPELRYNQTQASFYGGNFWDGRATGTQLGNPAAEQAQGPPVDPHEMANPDAACVVWKLSRSRYKSVFEKVWGTGSLSSITWPANVAKVCSTPMGAAVFKGNPTPLHLSPADRTLANQAYDDFGQAIRAYEASSFVNAFTSRFDYSLAHPDQKVLSAKEEAGYALFNGEAHCNQCHLDGRSSLTEGGARKDPGAVADVAPVFTDFTFNNLGLPENTQELPWYHETQSDQWGFVGNPRGAQFTDTGLGLLLSGYYGPPSDLQWKGLESQFDGTFMTSTLRDVAMVPRAGFVKAYMHNGYLKSLKQVVHFYNTRDVYAYHVTSGNCPAGTIEKVNCWPEPEDPNNLNHQIGRLGLTDAQEDDIVAFLKTLTDGYDPKTRTVHPLPRVPNF